MGYLDLLVPQESILRNRQFVYLWSAQGLSQTAQQATWFGMLVVVQETSRSSAVLAAAILSTVLPGVVVGLIAGVVVDRSKKKNVLVWTNLLRAVVILGYLFYPISLAVVFAVNIMFVAISQFFGPAEAAAIPDLVRRRQLLGANTLFNFTFTISQMIGIVLLAPWMIKFAGAPALFVIIALIYLVCSGLVMLLPASQPPARGLDTLRRETLVADTKRDLGEAWSFITTDRQTWWSMVYLTTASAVILVMAMLVPGYMDKVVGLQAVDAVFLFAPTGVGVVLVSAVLGRLAKKRRLTSLSQVGLVVAALAMITLGFVDRIFLAILNLPVGLELLPILVVVSAAFGVGFGLINISSQTLLMTRAPAPSRGRIFAMLLMLGNMAAVLPIVFLGSIADFIGINNTIAIVGVLVATVFLISKTGLARAEDPAPAKTGS